MSLDLHGFTVAEAVGIFVRHYNQRLARGNLSGFTVVHGYGSGGTGGRIRTVLRRFLSAFQEELSFTTDPVNPGATFIMPLKRLPEGPGILTGAILDFCKGGKSESKILGKFRNYGDLQVKKLLRRLVKRGVLTLETRGRHSIYSS